jgi:hypothetical protein
MTTWPATIEDADAMMADMPRLKIGKPKRLAWRKAWKALGATLAAAMIYLGAMWARQPDVPVQAAPPVQAVTETEYQTTADYQTTVDGWEIRIKAGFRFDGASIPRAGWTLLGLQPFSGTVVRAALIHDALYASERVSKQTADDLFRQALIEDGTAKAKAEACWRAVRDWGYTAWDQHTTASVAAARTMVEAEKR